MRVRGRGWVCGADQLDREVEGLLEERVARVAQDAGLLGGLVPRHLVRVRGRGGGRATARA